MNEIAAKRLIERHNSAAIRALSGRSDVSFRHQRLWTEKGPVSLKTSHLSLDTTRHSYTRCRGVADAISLRLKHSDPDIHSEFMPRGFIAQMIFDTLEQIRVEYLADAQLPGQINNLQHAFIEWQREYITKGLTENHAGLVLFTLIQVVRSNMLAIMPDREVTPIIEEPQFHVIPIISVPLAQLRKTIHDQKAYAAHALQISKLITDYLHQDMDPDEVSRRDKIPMPEDFEDIKNFSSGIKKGNKTRLDASEPDSDYYVFTRAYDRVVEGAKLYSLSQRLTLREQLDKQIAAQVISIPKLALRLQKLFGIPQRSGWDFGQDEGRIDARRLTQLISNPDYKTIFKREHLAPNCNLAISFVIDNSGSMKRQKYESVAVLVDIYCKALELAGASTEILGFTSGSWNGGRALHDWRKAGQPANPGRLNEAQFIVYKDADTSYRRARVSIASLINTLHYREGLDGEALDWAAKRLSTRQETRKVLILISDGAPMDSATANANGEAYLSQHLYDVAFRIEQRSTIELRAIGIDLDMSDFVEHSINLDLKGTLDNEAFSALETLFS